MPYWRGKEFVLSLALIVCFCVLPGAAHADTLYSGQVAGSFVDPVLSGNIISNGNPVPYDNSTTAVYGGIGGHAIRWGDNYFGMGSPSYLVFTGNDFSNVPANTPFVLGTLYYFDGVNSLASVIFGANLVVSIPNLTANGNPATFIPDSLPFGIITTQNTSGNAYLDADYVNFYGVGEIGAFEQASLEAELVAEMTGTGVGPITWKIPPGQTPGDPTPEPNSALLLALGLALAGGAIVLRGRRVSL